MKHKKSSHISRTIRLIPISVFAATLFVITPVYVGLVDAAASATAYSRDFTLSKNDPTVRGKVLALDGTTVTVEGKNDAKYVIDASGAAIKKSGKEIAVSDINIGDIIAVRGTVSSSLTAAATTSESQPRRVRKAKSIAHNLAKGALTFGTVSSVSGTSFTLDTRHATGTVQYTVTTDSATVFKKNGQNDSMSSLVAGARVMVKGKKDPQANLAGLAGGAITATEVVFVVGKK